jgi:LysR family transcriptional regulator, cyn operon transcriptional activator
MEPFSLRCFVAVARRGSFSRAAVELSRTQPAVSLQVRKLENELGQPLFDRTRRAPVMTEAGRSLYAAAQDLLERLDRLPEQVTSSRAEPAGTLTIASNLSLISHFLPGVLRGFHRSFPNVRLRLLNCTSRGIERSIEEGEADVGVGFLIEDHPGIEVVVVFKSSFVVVTAKTAKVLPRAEKRMTSLDMVLLGPIVHFEEGVELRRFLERNLTAGRSLQPVIELPSIESILQFVNDGFGSTILPAFAISDQWKKKLVIRELGRALAPLEVRACTRRNRTLSRAAAVFLDLACRTGKRTRQAPSRAST